MSPRQVGSGTATGEANGCARILAAQFMADIPAIRKAKTEFDGAATRRRNLGAGGGRGFSPDSMAKLLANVPRALGLQVRTAKACGLGEAGDVLIEVQGGAKVRIEIKAQLTLADFTWMQSADWIRGETDFLGELIAQDATAHGELSDEVREFFVEPYQKERGWDLSALWVADLAGMTNRACRRRLGVTTRAHLAAFLETKFLVHITQEGLRMFRLAEVPNLTAALSGGGMRYFLKKNKRSELTVWTRGDGQIPKHGTIHFTYYLGQNGRADRGGHHLHDAFFEGAKPLLKVKA